MASKKRVVRIFEDKNAKELEKMVGDIRGKIKKIQILNTQKFHEYTVLVISEE